ncbi:MAG: glutamate--tRNA ligase [Clostridia bacterium]
MNEKLNDKYMELANLIFPEIVETVEDLEIKYPKRQLKPGACVTRFAPSPTGFLHTGALFTSLVNKKLAMQTDGVFFLRIEDTDRKREVKGSIKLFTKELKQYGLSPMEGVISDTEQIGLYGPYIQSEREKIYNICAKRLIEKGLAYPCFCTTDMIAKTKETQEKNKVIPGYYGVYAKCRNISIDESIEKVKSGEKYILRFRSNGSHLKKTFFIDAVRGKIEIAQNDQDVVLIKADGLPTYHFAHVVDDHFMRTTHVVRGEEWISSTPIHIELFEAMGFEKPVYVHVPLILVKDGNSKRKLSKRKDKEAAVSYFLKSGYQADAVMEYLYTILNSDFEIWRSKNKETKRSEFKMNLNKMSSAGSLLDIMKLNDISKELISKMDSKEVLENVLAWTKTNEKQLYDILSKDLKYSKEIFALERDGAKKIRKDITKWEDIKENFFYFFDELYMEDFKKNGYEFDYLTNKENTKIDSKITKKALELYIKKYCENDDKQSWFETLKSCANELEFCTDMKEYKQNPDKYIGSTSDFATIIRVAVTNRHNTPDIYAIMQLIGKDETLKRLKMAIDKI